MKDFTAIVKALEAEQKRRKEAKSAGKPKRQPPMSKKVAEAQTQKAELKKVPALKKAGQKKPEVA
jgi:hypothetical protein